MVLPRKMSANNNQLPVGGPRRFPIKGKARSGQQRVGVAAGSLHVRVLELRALRFSFVGCVDRFPLLGYFFQHVGLGHITFHQPAIHAHIIV